ncbi:hypothetical protein BLD44_010955 [Mastigocladus laminosus UU774]|nr:hypothetical protein B4U84_28775 [Westiellopsis prolifica IICB1]TFI54205.1 hypothetical protein BLD44_010955 [Mastigocladus laminosus UU774]
MRDLFLVKNLYLIYFYSFFLLFIKIFEPNPTYAQANTQNQDQQLGTGNSINGNVTFGSQLQKINRQEIENQYLNFDKLNTLPLDEPIFTPINTENDFGFNMSFGINTLDTSNTTIYLGFIFQPGRTYSHKTRMEYLKKRTELLEVQEQIAKTQLQILQQQIAEAEARLQRLEQIKK